MVRTRAPRFDEYSTTSCASSRVMKSNRSKNTTPEMLIRSALWARGYRYRLHITTLPGKPDIVFPSSRVAVFVDGDFWHGKDWTTRKLLLESGSNSEYWVDKISYNIDRDCRVNDSLSELGWTVVRIWESDVESDCEREGQKIVEVLDSARR